MTRVASSIAIGLLLSALYGCGNDDGGGETAGRGTDACQEWQDAICDFAADKCKGISRSDCEDNYYGVTCKSDKQASDCVAKLKTLSCYNAPIGCDITDVADPKPAIDDCNRFFREFCQKAIECGASATVDECVDQSQANASVSCDEAIAVGPTYDKCMDDIGDMSCTASDMPDSCTDVILTTP